MRLVRVGLGALSLVFVCGCVRLGYDARRGPTQHKPDGSQSDGGVDSGTDAAVPDARNPPDADALDGSSMQDAGMKDGSIGSAGKGGSDATMMDSAVVPNDAEMEASIDDASMDASDTPDASAPDTGPVEPSPPDLCPSRADSLFCDGFEDSSFDNWSYPVIMNGTATQTTTQVHSGVGAMRATTGAAGSNAARYGAKVFANRKSGDLWLRYWYYLPTSTVVNTYFSTGVIAEIEQPFFGYALLVAANRVDLGIFDTKYPGTMAFPRNHWTCVEIHIQIDPTAGVVEAYLDGLLAARKAGIDTLPDMGYTSIDVGIHYTDASQGPVEAYADDVVAGITRAGCN
jgi:hypothetical protein